MAFLPSTFQRLCLWKIPLHFLEIWLKLYPVWKREKEGWVRKTQILMNLKRQIAANRPMQIAKNSDQFEKSAFEIVGNKGEYTLYRYIPFKSNCATTSVSAFSYDLCFVDIDENADS